MKWNLLMVLISIPFLLFSQPSWKRSNQPVSVPINMFHASQTANLPTAETMQKGDFMYEISHRFASITSGYSGLYGLDGPVTMRTALSYGIMDELMVTAGRSNIQDNLDLRLKYRLNALEILDLHHLIALQAGIAFNTETFAGLKKRSALNTNSIQYYGQVIYNTMFLEKKLGLGIVPSFVYNSYIFSSEYSAGKKFTIALPTYLQYYFNRMWSVFVEYTAVIAGWKGNIYFDANPQNRSHNSISSGLAIETGGHVFFLFMTNNERLNPTQYLTGASAVATDKTSWRLAFGITRVL